MKKLILLILLLPTLAFASKPVFYSVSPVGTSTDMKVAANIVISSGVATLSVEQTGNIGAGCRINYNSTHAFIAPNRIGFDSGGTVEIKIGDKIAGGTSAATGIVRAVHLSSGTWAGGDAAGYVYFERTTGTWQDNEQINRVKPSASTNVGTTDGTLEGNIGNGNTQFVVLTATGGTPNDQTSTSVTNIYHEYASLSAWESGCIDANHLNSTNLTTADVVMYATCFYDHDDGTDDTTSLVIDGQTCDADNYFYIVALSGGAESINNQRSTTGVWDNSKATLAVTDDNCILAWRCSWIEGLQLDQIESTTSDSSRRYGIRFSDRYSGATAVCVVNDCIIRGPGTAGADKGGIYSAAYIVDAYNNLIYNYPSSWCSGIAQTEGFSSADSVLHAYNNTIYGCNLGFYIEQNAAGVTLKNNIVQSSAGNAYSDTTYNASSDYNISDDTSDTGGANDISSATVTFSDAGNNDYRLASSDTTAIDEGATLLTDSVLPIWDDLIGGIRGSSWDIGAFEYIATSTGWTSKIYEVSPAKVYSGAKADIAKIQGVK